MTRRRDLFESLVRNPYNPYRFLSEAEGEDSEPESAEESELNPGGSMIINKSTNIKDLKHPDTWEQLTSGDETKPLVDTIKNATGWSAGTFEKAGGASELKKWAESVGQVDLEQRIKKVGESLPPAAPDKHNMPALEGDDAPSVKDALSPGGDYTVDITAPDANNEEDFEAWFSALSREDKAAFEAGKVPGKEQTEGRVSLSSVIFEDRYPRNGTDPLPGVPTKLEGTPPATRQEITGKALAFLTKGMLDGNVTDDKIEVKVGATLNNDSMIPTQNEILAGKSLLFAFLHGRKVNDLSDMGGAFVTTKNEILDGHHRWSGARIAQSGLTHTNVNIVTGEANDLIPILISVGNAIGRGQKDVPEELEKESRKNATSDSFIFERWQKIAGTLKG